jgi:hypothetical protein
MIGLGTPHAESASSYFLRVADTNGFSPLQLIWGTNSALLTKTDPQMKALQAAGKGCFHRRAVATSTNGQEFMAVLAGLVGRSELKRMHWATSFPDFSLARMSRDCDVWCTDCLREDRKPYGRFVWEIPFVTRCSVHNCRLETVCHSCHQAVRWAAGKDVVHCRHCGFDRRDAPPSPEKASPETAVAAQFGELVACATSPRGDFVGSAAKCVSALRDLARREGHVGLRAEAAFLGLDKVSLWNWEHGKSAPSVARIMESVLRLGLSAVDILRGLRVEKQSRDQSIQPVEIEKRWSCVRLTAEHRADLTQRLSDLARAFPSMGPLRAAKKLGVEPVTLNQIAPEQCAAMVASRKKTLARLRKSRFAWFKNKVDRYVAAMACAGERPTWGGLMRQFRKSTILLDPAFGQYAKNALRPT